MRKVMRLCVWGGGRGQRGWRSCWGPVFRRGTRPCFLDYNLAGIDRHGLDDAGGPYMSSPSLRSALSCSSLPAPVMRRALVL